MSYADKYFAHKRKQSLRGKHLSEYELTKDFNLDEFQLSACAKVESGDGVLVAAPTGAGKTIVGEFAVYLALQTNTRAYYTTPIKALSNQKYQELVDSYGESKIGLLTGDVSINPNAEIIVMTTEVLRNMIYASSSALERLAYVVLDEVHYLADRSRGAVWEEVILHLPLSIQIIALSATVSNAEEFGDWLGTVRGNFSVIVEESRPVPLWQFVASRQGLFDLFVDEDNKTVNPRLLGFAHDDARSNRSNHRFGYSRHTPNLYSLIDTLDDEGLLPGIYFIFSRAGCDSAVEDCISNGIRLTSEEEVQFIRNFVQGYIDDLSSDDLVALKAHRWQQALESGIAAHHAGLLPRFKEVVEKLFQLGYLKLVFATETLSLGINMPAKSVLIDKLTKWNGEQHVQLSPGEYTQLTGRAGRRGIDIEGNSIVIWHKDLDPIALGNLASTRTYPLRSSFKPGYSMAVNVLTSLGFEHSRALLERSFAQYQADKSVAKLLIERKKFDEGIDGFFEAMSCDQGDFEEYMELRRKISDLEKGRNVYEVNYQRGDVVELSKGRHSLPAVITSSKKDARGKTTHYLLDAKGKIAVLQGGPVVIGRIRLKESFNPKLAGNVLNQLWEFDSKSKLQSTDIDSLRIELKNHPCHHCKDRDQHARWGERWVQAKREKQRLDTSIQRRTNVLRQDFERIIKILVELGYLQTSGNGYDINQPARLLKRIHTESDLLLAQVLQHVDFSELDIPTYSALMSVLVYESRSDRDQRGMRLHKPEFKYFYTEFQHLSEQIQGVEASNNYSSGQRLDQGFAWTVYQWANGVRLTELLSKSEISAGDFVRSMRRLLDLLEQISRLNLPNVSKMSQDAILILKRGILVVSDFEE
ncbi:MAG: DEAD/DEAH box helicase [Candidatus Nanopelagicales bacterium]